VKHASGSPHQVIGTVLMILVFLDFVMVGLPENGWLFASSGLKNPVLDSCLETKCDFLNVKAREISDPREAYHL
jgi:hypothetical protein